MSVDPKEEETAFNVTLRRLVQTPPKPNDNARGADRPKPAQRPRIKNKANGWLQSHRH